MFGLGHVKILGGNQNAGPETLEITQNTTTCPFDVVMCCHTRQKQCLLQKQLILALKQVFCTNISLSQMQYKIFMWPFLSHTKNCVLTLKGNQLLPIFYLYIRIYMHFLIPGFGWLVISRLRLIIGTSNSAHSAHKSDLSLQQQHNKPLQVV